MCSHIGKIKIFYCSRPTCFNYLYFTLLTYLLQFSQIHNTSYSVGDIHFYCYKYHDAMHVSQSALMITPMISNHAYIDFMTPFPPFLDYLVFCDPTISTCMYIPPHQRKEHFITLSE